MLEIKVNGMTCGGCVNSVTKAVQRVDPGANVKIDLKTKLVQVETQKEESDIRSAITDAGYEITEINGLT